MRKHITVSVDESVYREARLWAARRDTSVSAVVQYLLERLPGLPAARCFHARGSRPAPSGEAAHHRPSAEEIAAFRAPKPAWAAEENSISDCQTVRSENN
jgi:hypothetical protein